MDAAQVFRNRFKPQGEAEAKWLEGLFHFVRDHVWPLMVDRDLTCPAGLSDDDGVTQLSASVLKRIRGANSDARTLPVSYTLTCVSELLSHQRVACASYPLPGTDRERAEAAPGRETLPRERLLLIGRLTDGGDGEWMLRDAGGGVVCEIVSPSPLWMGRLVFLPRWQYFPRDLVGQEDPEPRGRLELMCSPVLLCPTPAPEIHDGHPISVKEALALLPEKILKRRLSVHGRVASVCPTLCISGIYFFFFTLSEDMHTVPILVKINSKLWWAKCLTVGDCVHVTALDVYALKPWGGKKVLCANSRSELHKTHDHWLAEEGASSLSHSPRDGAGEPAEEGATSRSDSARGLRRSEVIDYQGTITEVVNEGAALFVMDGELGLCLAHRPETSRRPRVGDRLLLHHLHYLRRPSPDFPPRMLCACLRSTVTVTGFGDATPPAPDRVCPRDGLLRRSLVAKNPDVSRYLWTCHLAARLRSSLLPKTSPQCVCPVAWELMERAFGRAPPNRRNIYAEMLDECHSCPLTQYGDDCVQDQYTNLSELCKALEQDCWASLTLRSLLPPGGGGQTSAQINAVLSWSSRILTSDPACAQGDAPALRERPLLLVGVLELPSSATRHTLQLTDRTGSVACVFTETDEGDDGDQSATFDTAWIGCLVSIRRFAAVTERYIQSEFPSYQHLDQDKFITSRNCSVYLQFSRESVHILSPSVGMERHLRAKGAESKEDEDESSSATATAYVSMVLRVEQKDGVTWREEESSFSVEATAVGPAATWGRDPRNGPIREVETGKERSVTLLCSGASARWFPLLQPGHLYRLVATGETDEFRWSRDVELRVRHGCKFHTLKRRFLAGHLRTQGAAVFTVSQVLDCSADLVTFEGLVTERLNLKDMTKDAGNDVIELRLVVCDQSGRSLHIYLKLNPKSYQPGLLPGNTLLFSAFRRRLSRVGRVYCSNVAVSWVAVVRLRDQSSEDRAPAPMMQLAGWTERSRTVGRVRGHLVRFLFMQLQWNCSMCGCVYTQSSCGSGCKSTSAFFDSVAKLVIEDGTGEAHVRVAGELLRRLLGLSERQWEGLQRALKARGWLQVYPKGRGQACDDDDLLQFLMLCARGVDAVVLTCSRESQGKEEVKRLTRGKRDFVTRMAPSLKLNCLHIH
ncbi:CST complex subunit CTC1 isoform X2 [Stigmatopora argus]